MDKWIEEIQSFSLDDFNALKSRCVQNPALGEVSNDELLELPILDTDKQDMSLKGNWNICSTPTASNTGNCGCSELKPIEIGPCLPDYRRIKSGIQAAADKLGEQSRISASQIARRHKKNTFKAELQEALKLKRLNEIANKSNRK